VQIQDAWFNIGKDAANALMTHLLRSNLGYARAFRTIVEASAPSDNPGVIDPIRIAAVALWCLMGDPVEHENFDPAVRLVRLLLLLRTNGGIASTDSIAGLWDHWNATLKLKDWRTSVKEMRDRTARSVKTYAMPDKKDVFTEKYSAFATVLETYQQDQMRATELLLNDPDAYVNTRTYVEKTRVALPMPLVSVKLGPSFIASIDLLPVTDHVRVANVVEHNGVKGWNRVIIDRSPVRPSLMDAALEVESFCKFCDGFLSEEALSPLESEMLARTFFEGTGMAPLFLF
jgi:hypothetical protein